MTSRIMAHGGAWDWDDSLDAGKHAGLKKALATGQKVLAGGGSALDAVEITVRALEDDPVFDAGTGGYLNQDGIVQLDALVVDGAKRDFGAVAGVTRAQNPVSLARNVMERTDQCFFVGDGADCLLESLGLHQIQNEHLVTEAMRDYYKARRTDGPRDTVGAVALDSDGNLACATSTSGTPYKPAGRVGDSPIYGAGGYADNDSAAAGATGNGEQIMRALLSKYVCDRVDSGVDAGKAAEQGTRYFEKWFPNSMSGVIVIDRAGNLGAAQTAPKLAFGWVDSGGIARTSMKACALTQP